MPDPASGGPLGLAAVCGQAAIVVSVALIVICALRTWPRARRVRRRARLLESRARSEQEVLFDGLVLLLAQGMEMKRLLEPWRRILFWLRHPLASALRDHYRRG